MQWSDLALAQLASWGIDAAGAERCGMFEAPARQIYPEFQALPAIVIPYYKPDGDFITFARGKFCRIRYLVDPPQPHSFGKPKKPQRYTQPRDSGVHVYFPPIIDWARILADPEEPVIITEGEAKAVAACLAGFPTLALGGVSSWGIGGGSETLHPELATGIAWTRKAAFIGFDSDAAGNASVLAAEAKLIDALQLQRGAQCSILRIPPGPNGAKVGLDDYLKAHGPDGLMALLKESQALGTLDAKIIALNKRVAWIKKEALVWDHSAKTFIHKGDFVTGDECGTLKHVQLSAGQRSSPKVINVAKAWLNHAHAARFDEILFRPSEPQMIENEEGRPALNMWSGWPSVGSGDVAPFLELTRFLFKHADPDMILKLLAYKAQHPEKKIPLALMIISPPGSGKGLWTEIVRDTFSPYSAVATSSQLSSTFRGWLEKSLVCVVNEVQKEDLLNAGETLKSLIADLRQPMNEKYRAVRDVNSYTLYIFTANKHAVASFEFDDRRWIITEAPSKKTLGDEAAQRAFYFGRVGAWKERGGARDLLGWLLRYDLQDWQPPMEAPPSIEKELAYQEGLTPIQKLAERMRQKGTSPVMDWLHTAEAWAAHAIVQGDGAMQQFAVQVSASIGSIQVRPFYEPRELALLFPHVIAANMGAGRSWRARESNSPEGQISRALRDEGIPFLRPRDTHKGFLWHGQYRQFLVISDIDDWTSPMSQAEFERLMPNFPSFAEAKHQLGLRQ